MQLYFYNQIYTCFLYFYLCHIKPDFENAVGLLISAMKPERISGRRYVHLRVLTDIIIILYIILLFHHTGFSKTVVCSYVTS